MQEIKELARKEAERRYSINWGLKDVFLDGAVWAESRDRWISVEERPPLCWDIGNWDGRRSDIILVKDKKDKICVAQAYEGHMDGSYFLHFCDTYHDFLLDDITHWQPIKL